MELERTFYKLLVIGLVTVTLYKAVMVYSGVVNIIEYTSHSRTSPSSKYTIAVVEQLLRVIGPFLIWLCATYWVPKTIKKLFPEVS